ncbi:IclR family transcriptional regulator [Actinomycetes bacterium NPDC127524]
MQNQNKTVIKSMEILNLFLQHPKLTLKEIADLSNIPKTSVHRMLGSLTEMGFLVRDKAGYYELGLMFLQFGQIVSQRLDIRKIALPFMRSLLNETGEAVNLIVRDGDEAIYVEKLDTQHPVRLFTAIGRRSPLYAGACSRIILANLKENERKDYIKKCKLLPLASGTITDKKLLEHTLETSRKEGYAVSYSELENHTVSVAAPIFDHEGEVAAGISLAGFEGNFGGDRLSLFIEKLKSEAAKISMKLGYRNRERV